MLGHEIFVAISVEVCYFHMPECWDLKSFYIFLQNLLPSTVLYLMTAPSGIVFDHYKGSMLESAKITVHGYLIG